IRKHCIYSLSHSDGIIGAIELHCVPANQALAILAPLVEVFVLKPELGEIVVVSRAGVDPPNIELPITGINGALNGYAIAYFPTKPLGDSRSSDCAFAIFQE